jgi:hypothetical protein
MVEIIGIEALREPEVTVEVELLKITGYRTGKQLLVEIVLIKFYYPCNTNGTNNAIGQGPLYPDIFFKNYQS